jgi:hypothetical protein
MAIRPTPVRWKAILKLMKDRDRDVLRISWNNYDGDRPPFYEELAQELGLTRTELAIGAKNEEHRPAWGKEIRGDLSVLQTKGFIERLDQCFYRLTDRGLDWLERAKTADDNSNTGLSDKKGRVSADGSCSASLRWTPRLGEAADDLPGSASPPFGQRERIELEGQEFDTDGATQHREWHFWKSGSDRLVS